jgi:hypothetical protein
MDAMIRFCFLVEPEDLDMDRYAKLYGQAQFMIDYTNLIAAKKAVGQ